MSANVHFSARACLLGLGFLAAVLLPLALLATLDRTFYVDWHNHLWQLAYQSEFLRVHGATAPVLHTVDRIGMAQPFFYGQVFYPLFARIGAFVGAAIAIRIAALILVALEIGLVAHALRRAGLSAAHALVIAVLPAWAIYPLTNLYNRSALTEYFATGLLPVCAAALFLGLRAAAPRARVAWLGVAILAATLAAGFHPITAVLSGPFLLLAVRELRSDMARGKATPWGWVAVPAVLGLMTLAPWVYAAASLGRQLSIHGVIRSLLFSTDGYDSWAARFSPLPFDPRVKGQPLDAISTPFLDTAVSLPLLFAALALVLAAGRENRKGWLPLAAGLVLAVFSVVGHEIPWLCRFLAPVQMSYRLVTYVNFCWLLACLATAGAAAARWHRSRLPGGIVIGCLVLALAGLQLKLERGRRVSAARGGPLVGLPTDGGAALLAGSPVMYGADDYLTWRFFPDREGTLEARFPVGTHADFGRVAPVTVDVVEPTRVATNIYAFAWNGVQLDGKTVAHPALGIDRRGKLTVAVPSGRHVLSYELVAPVIHAWLGRIQAYGAVGWVLFLAWAACASRASRRQSEVTSSHFPKVLSQSTQ